MAEMAQEEAMIDAHSNPEPEEVSTEEASVNALNSVGNQVAGESENMSGAKKGVGASPSALGLWTCKRDGRVRLRLEERGPASLAAVTVPQLFLRAVAKFGDLPALTAKNADGQWEHITFRDYYQQCRLAARAFLKLGLDRFHGVCILGFNSVEWFISDIAAILAGGFAVGIYTTNSPEACKYIAENCSANIIVVENDKQLQKILEVKSKLPLLKAIIQYGEPIKEKKPNLYSWSDFLALGKQIPEEVLDVAIGSQVANQCCTLIYTSGTTGDPKGVMLSHDNITWTARAAGAFVNLREGTEEQQEVVVSYLPLSHIAAQMVDIWLPLTFGALTAFAQPDALKGTLVETLKEVQPTAFMGVPRVWEKMQERMKAVGAKNSALKRRLAAWAKVVGMETNLKRMIGSPEEPLKYRFARALVYRKVRKALGLERCTRCYTAAAPISRETLEYFLSLDIPVYELYGMSESSGPHTVSDASAFRITSCGKAMVGCRTRLYRMDAEGVGEVCFFGRHVFMGYLNMEEKTKEAIDQEGWLHSGDLGKHDHEGFLYITGRIKELIITAGGENVAPVPIEDAVKEALPILSNAMLLGDKAKFLSMLLTLKCTTNLESGEPEDTMTPEAVEFCRRLGSRATKVSEVVTRRDPVVYNAIQKAISAINKRAPSNAQKVQKWILLERDFSIPGGELGPTMKLKRPVVMQMYKEQINQMYSES